MTKEKVLELYKKYEEADYEYHKYVDQFITIVMNGQVTQEATRDRNPEDAERIEKLDKEAYTAGRAFNDALHQWIDSL